METIDMRERRVPSWILTVLFGLYVVTVLSLTTGPQPPGRYDIAGNILLFAPLGVLLSLQWPRFPQLGVVLAGFAVSSGIELAQLVLLTDRNPSLNDIALNTSGTALGCIAAATLWDAASWLLDRSGPRAG